MFKLILSAVKEILGEDGLLALLELRDPDLQIKTDVSEVELMKSKKTPLYMHIQLCKRKEFMRTTAEFLDNFYEKLNKFLFKIDYEDFDFVKLVGGNIVGFFGEENLLGMIQAEGFSNWLKLVLDNTDLETGFTAFIEESFLNFLRKNGLVTEYVKTLISSSCKEEEDEDQWEDLDEEVDCDIEEVKMTYLAKLFSTDDWFYEKDEDSHPSRLHRLLKFFSEEQHRGQEILKELVSINQCLFIFDILMTKPRIVFQVLFAYLLEENRKEICTQIFNYLSTMTLPIRCLERCNPLMARERVYSLNLSNAIWYISRYNFQCHTGNICKFLLSIRDCAEGRKRSFWSVFMYVYSYDTETLVEALDFLTEKLGKDKSSASQKIKDLVLHDDGTGIVIFKAAKEGNDNGVRILLKYLTEADRNEVIKLLRDKKISTLRVSKFILPQ